jgi:hypothetical protein
LLFLLTTCLDNAAIKVFMPSEPATPDLSPKAQEQFGPAPVEVERAVSTALAIAGQQAPAEIAAAAEAAPTPEVRERKIEKTKVLCRKAVERTDLLKRSSRALIGVSKALVCESKRRRARGLQFLERLRAA